MRTRTIKRKSVRRLLTRLTQSQHIFSAKFRRRRDLVIKRNGVDVVLAPAGSVRELTCKLKPNILPTRNWQSKGGRLPFDPASKDLFHVYTVEGMDGNDGRGNHWGFICLRTVFEIVYDKIRYKIVE